MRSLSRRRGPASEEVALNITSMMDMFTIILVFLLFSFKSQDEQFEMTDGITLPESVSLLELQNAVGVSVTPEAILVEGQPVVTLDKGKLRDEEPRDGETILALREALLRQKQLLEEPPDGSEPRPQGEREVIMFQADRRARFKVIDAVMKTGARAGFPKFRFAVLKR